MCTVLCWHQWDYSAKGAKGACNADAKNQKTLCAATVNLQRTQMPRTAAGRAATRLKILSATSADIIVTVTTNPKSLNPIPYLKKPKAYMFAG